MPRMPQQGTRPPRRRFVWKTLFLRSFQEAELVQAAWQNFSSAPRHQLVIMRETVETNLPWRDLRALLRFAGVPMPHNVVTDVAPSGEAAEEDTADFPAATSFPDSTRLVGIRPGVKTSGLTLWLLRSGRKGSPAVSATPEDKQAQELPSPPVDGQSGTGKFGRVLRGGKLWLYRESLWPPQIIRLDASPASAAEASGATADEQECCSPTDQDDI